MNVTCPSCATVFRVDPGKVPEAGVRARCSVCSAVFSVQREATTAALEPRASASVPTHAPPPAAAPVPLHTPEPAPMPSRHWEEPAATEVMTTVTVPTAPPMAPAAAQSMPPAPAPTTARPAAVPAAPPLPAVPAEPAAARAATAARSAAPAAPTKPAAPRPVNPFLSQDPALKARRLARALISDMVVYHPSKRRDGLRDGNLKEVFQEEIQKSWEEYSDQVGKDVAESTPYFREALNEILADGNQIF